MRTGRVDNDACLSCSRATKENANDCSPNFPTTASVGSVVRLLVSSRDSHAKSHVEPRDKISARLRTECVQKDTSHRYDTCLCSTSVDDPANSISSLHTVYNILLS